MSASRKTQEELFTLCQQALEHCKPYPAEVLAISSQTALTRFANNFIHQNVSEEDTTLNLRILDGKRIGTASTNRLDGDGLSELANRARHNAQAGPDDAHFPGFLESATYLAIAAFDPPTADLSPQLRAEQVRTVCNLAVAEGLSASGAFSSGNDQMAVANTYGIFAYHASTHADFQTVIMGQDSSGHAHASAWRVADIPMQTLTREAIQKAQRGREPRAIPPGEYCVLLDPYATQDLLAMLNWHGMGAQSVSEGRSWMNGHIGEKVMDSRVSIWDDGVDLTGIPAPFDYEGVPKQRVDIVQAGVVSTPVYDRRTALQANVTSTGHALHPSQHAISPLASNLFLAPGESGLEEMIKATRRGLYITRFWYTRLVHPHDCVITGMTRDGVFWIENGEIAYPVKNLRFTQPYVQALNSVEAIGRETRLLISQYGSNVCRVPAIRLAHFNFTGVTV
jgi:PmbA protein